MISEIHAEKEDYWNRCAAIAERNNLNALHGEVLVQQGLSKNSEQHLRKAAELFARAKATDELRMCKLHIAKLRGRSSPSGIRRRSSQMEELLDMVEELNIAPNETIPIRTSRDNSLESADDLDLLARDEPEREHSLAQHEFADETPRCAACSKLIWGLNRVGWKCSVCAANFHDECRANTCSGERPHSEVHQIIPWSFAAPSFCFTCTALIAPHEQGSWCIDCGYCSHEGCAPRSSCNAREGKANLRARFNSLNSIEQSEPYSDADIRDLPDVMRRMLIPVNGVRLFGQQHLLLPCLVCKGGELVSWLMRQDLPVARHSDALAIADALVRYGYIAPLSGDAFDIDAFCRIVDATRGKDVASGFAKRVESGFAISLEDYKIKAASEAAVVKTIVKSEGGAFAPFVFKDYEPATFLHIREHYGIDTGEFKASLIQPLTFVRSSSSGSGVYRTGDHRYVLKTLSRCEVAGIHKNLSGYLAHIETYPRSILPKLLGLYEIQTEPRNCFLLCVFVSCCVFFCFREIDFSRYVGYVCCDGQFP